MSVYASSGWLTIPCIVLTVVGQASFAETAEQVLLHLLRRHILGAHGTVEAWG